MKWYDPGEDSYTFLDVLQNENIQKQIVVDLGCSTGILTDFLEKKNFVISIDLNTRALEQLEDKNAVRTDLLAGMNQSLVGTVVFNPPYVPDFDCPILGGGLFGRETIDRFVEEIEAKCFYLLIIEANKPLEVISNIRSRNYQVDILRVRRVLGETIIILKAIRTSEKKHLQTTNACCLR